MEYTPYGETWVEENSDSSKFITYKFTSKDEAHPYNFQPYSSWNIESIKETTTKNVIIFLGTSLRNIEIFGGWIYHRPWTGGDDYIINFSGT